ncbi:MAG: hypothetical protein V1248_07805 [Acidimicrobiales bacterium]|nr:hypothetical protein [Acidimicrobiales bacterium]MDP7411333.1 hypothetical protein [Acidimicrobiales bacterium]MEE1522719.1 hypothetical protein [Acidimicrobiales bacterium]
MAFTCFKDRLGMCLIAVMVAGALYGFFGPGRDPTCGGEFRSDDWVANHLYCPGLSALSMVWWILLVGVAVILLVDRLGLGR